MVSELDDTERSLASRRRNDAFRNFRDFYDVFPNMIDPYVQLDVRARKIIRCWPRH